MKKGTSLHILLAIPTLQIGGAERMVVDLANSLTLRGYTVSVLLMKPEYALRAALSTEIAVHTVPKSHRLDLGYTRRVRRMLQELQPDIVHTHLFGSDFYTGAAARALGIPHVVTEHNINKTEGRVRHVLKRYALSRASFCVAVSREVLAYMTRAFGVKGSRTRVIYPGIDTALFAKIPIIKKTHPIRFGLVGRLERQKGFDRALRALAALEDRDWQCTVIGSGSEHAALRRLTSALRIEDRVVFFPSQNDQKSLYIPIDVLLFPSRWEGFGRVVLEAMMSGRVVLAAEVGGVKEIITDKHSGVLAGSGTVPELLEGLRWICAHRASLPFIAKNARTAAAQIGSQDAMADAYEGVYTEVLRR